jgi:hypothetical protein
LIVFRAMNLSPTPLGLKSKCSCDAQELDGEQVTIVTDTTPGDRWDS